jgi:Cd(II)/Pb(II)-responsive transcriptional regulator
MAHELFKIGQLATQTGSKVETIRYYEQQRLLPQPARSDGNYRLYGAGHVKRLQFIRHCRSLDMTLDEIRTLLDFRDTPDANCAGVNTLLDKHIGHVADRIRVQLLRSQGFEALQLRDGVAEWNI